MDVTELQEILVREDFSLGITYTAIVSMALLPIWIGSHRSLNQKSGAEQLTTADAYKFPFIGSAILLGLYVLFVYVSKEYVNMLLTAYFLFFGILAVSASIRPVFFHIFSGKNKKDKPTHVWRIPIPFKEPAVLKWSGIDVLSLLVGIAVGAWYVMTKHWVVNNILGLAFSIQGISLLALGSYQTGCLLLGGLFLYDIFWVFGTDVMVTVAKSFDAPIKLLWPRDLFTNAQQFSMLGLGDIILPGIFIALVLRFDAKRAKSMNKDISKGNFNKPYFSFTYIGYLAGLVTTIVVMHCFQAAQPALLYLVPFCVGASLLCSILLGETTRLIFYSEEKSDKPRSKKGQSKKGRKGKKRPAKRRVVVSSSQPVQSKE